MRVSSRTRPDSAIRFASLSESERSFLSGTYLLTLTRMYLAINTIQYTAYCREITSTLSTVTLYLFNLPLVFGFAINASLSMLSPPIIKMELQKDRKSSRKVPKSIFINRRRLTNLKILKNFISGAPSPEFEMRATTDNPELIIEVELDILAELSTVLASEATILRSGALFAVMVIEAESFLKISSFVWVTLFFRITFFVGIAVNLTSPSMLLEKKRSRR